MKSGTEDKIIIKYKDEIMVLPESCLKWLQEELFITKKNRIFYTIQDYFNNIGFLGGNYADYRFKSHIWA